jgi:hypothetical protein
LKSTCDVGYRLLALAVLDEDRAVVAGWSSKISILNITTGSITHTIDTGVKRCGFGIPSRLHSLP